jgi:hypothetical protein
VEQSIHLVDDIVSEDTGRQVSEIRDENLQQIPSNEWEIIEKQTRHEEGQDGPQIIVDIELNRREENEEIQVEITTNEYSLLGRSIFFINTK